MERQSQCRRLRLLSMGGHSSVYLGKSIERPGGPGGLDDKGSTPPRWLWPISDVVRARRPTTQGTCAGAGGRAGGQRQRKAWLGGRTRARKPMTSLLPARLVVAILGARDL